MDLDFGSMTADEFRTEVRDFLAANRCGLPD